MQTTAQRLQAARDRANKANAAREKSPLFSMYPDKLPFVDWRNNVARPFRGKPTPGSWQRDYTGHKSGRPYYIDGLDAMAWRVTGDAADILRNAGGWRAADSCNWYADNHRDAVIKSAVLQLPSRDGTPVYIPATYCSDWDGATCWPLDQYDTPEDAARAAAGYADAEAEESREFYAKDAAEQQIEEKRAEIHKTNRAALALIREIKAAGASFTPAICSALRGQLHDYLNERREAFERIDRLTAEYWEAVQ